MPTITEQHCWDQFVRATSRTDQNFWRCMWFAINEQHYPHINKYYLMQAIAWASRP